TSRPIIWPSTRSAEYVCVPPSPCSWTSTPRTGRPAGSSSSTRGPTPRSGREWWSEQAERAHDSAPWGTAVLHGALSCVTEPRPRHEKQPNIFTHWKSVVFALGSLFANIFRGARASIVVPGSLDMFATVCSGGFVDVSSCLAGVGVYTS